MRDLAEASAEEPGQTAHFKSTEGCACLHVLGQQVFPEASRQALLQGGCSGEQAGLLGPHALAGGADRRLCAICHAAALPYGPAATQL